jgi:MurNAc alpha-1-phosphate uridylyltransferase
MVLAAGFGTRMRPLTESLAKPLLPLGGKPLLDHALDRLAAAGVERVVVNAHWRAELVQRHVAGRAPPPEVLVTHEPALLDTGGSVAAMLPELGPDPFFVVNGDAFWLDGPSPTLRRIAEAWADDLDAVLLVQRGFAVHAEVGDGDFAMDPWGAVRRPREREIVPYVFAGIQLLSPRLFAARPSGAFSMNLLWDRAIEAGRLRAVVHDGLWFHLSSPPDLADAEAQLHEGTTSGTR